MKSLIVFYKKIVKTKFTITKLKKSRLKNKKEAVIENLKNHSVNNIQSM